MSYTNLLTQIKNAQNADKNFLKFPYSKMDNSVAEILEKRGFLKKVEVKGRRPKKTMKLHLNPDRLIKGIQFVSKPSRKIYKGYKELRPVKSGYGLLVVSTPKGLLTESEARKEKTGGQLLFKIW